MTEDEEMMTEPEDELTEQMIAAVQSLKEQFSATLQQINEAHKAEVKEKDARISTLSSEVSTLKSEVQKLAERIETQSNADLLTKENSLLREEIRRQKESNERIQGLLGHANELRQAAKNFPEAIDAMKRSQSLIERSNEKIRIELSEETKNAAQGLLQPFEAMLEGQVEKSRQLLLINVVSKWTALIFFILAVVFAGYTGYRLEKQADMIQDNRAAIGRVGVNVNKIKASLGIEE